MKKCPVCHIKYTDDVEYCAKCHAYLDRYDLDSVRNTNIPVDRKRLVRSIVFTCAFMLAIAGIYWLIGLLSA